MGEKRTQAETTFLSNACHSLNTIPEGHNDSPDPNRRGEGDFYGVANEDHDFRRVSNMVVEKTLEDVAPM